MKRKHYSVEQIVAALKHAELGMPVADLIRQPGISSRRVTVGKSSTRTWNRTRSAYSSGCRTRMSGARSCSLSSAWTW